MRKIDKMLAIATIIFIIVITILLLGVSILPQNLKHKRIAGFYGLAFNFWGTFIIAFTVIRSDYKIKKITKTLTYNGHMPELEKDMLQNRRWTFGGLILIGVGFICQFLDIIISYYQ